MAGEFFRKKRGENPLFLSASKAASEKQSAMAAVKLERLDVPLLELVQFLAYVRQIYSEERVRGFF